jgi:hypothetical protein
MDTPHELRSPPGTQEIFESRKAAGLGDKLFPALGKTTVLSSRPFKRVLVWRYDGSN